MKNLKVYENYINESNVDYEYLVDLLLKANPKYGVYYDSDWNVVNIGGTGYRGGNLVKAFGEIPGSSSRILSNFYHAAQSPEVTKERVESLSDGKIEVEITPLLVIYRVK
jgi:hypothetical protein